MNIEQAKSKGLEFVCNLYGDIINYTNARSLWKDSKGKQYFIKELYYDTKRY